MYTTLGACNCSPSSLRPFGGWFGADDDVPTPGQQSPPIVPPTSLFDEHEAAGVKYRAVVPYYRRLVHSDLIAFDRQSEATLAGGQLLVATPYAVGVDPARNPHGTYDAWRWVEARITECGLKTVPCLKPTGILVEPNFQWQSGQAAGPNRVVKIYASASPTVLAAIAGPDKAGFVLYEPPQGWTEAGGVEVVSAPPGPGAGGVPKWLLPGVIVAGVMATAAYLGLR